MKSILLALMCLLGYVTHAQSINNEITNGKNPYLLGKVNKVGLTSTNYKTWFEKNYSEYEADKKIIQSISNELKSYSITIFMGTWCGDSKRQVPPFFKILEQADFPMDRLTVIAVSREPNMYKQSPDHEERGLNIHRVPTFIFYKNGKETNRIVEKPVESLEKDIQDIMADNYNSNYQIVTAVDDILKKDGIKGLKREEKELLKAYNNKVSSMYELNTYARILHGTDKKEQAIAVFKFNTKLFPDNPRVYMSLANTLGANGQKEEAIKVLEEALEVHPENEDLKENLEVVRSN